MKVSTVIDELKKLDPNEEIVVSWFLNLYIPAITTGNRLIGH